MSNGLHSATFNTCALSDKLDATIKDLERTGLLPSELAEYRNIEASFGGATARLAAEALIQMWQESSADQTQSAASSEFLQR